MVPIVLWGRPHITPEYHQRLTDAGLDPNLEELNPAPVDGSVEAKCQRCGDPIWIGPRQQHLLNETLTSKGDQSVWIECLLCGYTVTAREAGVAIVTSLSEE